MTKDEDEKLGAGLLIEGGKVILWDYDNNECLIEENLSNLLEDEVASYLPLLYTSGTCEADAKLLYIDPEYVKALNSLNQVLTECSRFINKVLYMEQEVHEPKLH